MKLVGWERSDHPHHAHEAPPAGCSKRVRCEARGSERGGIAELCRTSERPSNDADRPFSATCARAEAEGALAASYGDLLEAGSLEPGREGIGLDQYHRVEPVGEAEDEARRAVRAD